MSEERLDWGVRAPGRERTAGCCVFEEQESWQSGWSNKSADKGQIASRNNGAPVGQFTTLKSTAGRGKRQHLISKQAAIRKRRKSDRLAPEEGRRWEGSGSEEV